METIQESVKSPKLPKCEAKPLMARRPGGLRNLTNAFDACDGSSSSISTTRTSDTNTTTDFLETSVQSVTDLSRDVSRDVSREVSRDVSREVSRDVSREVSRDVHICQRSLEGSETTSVASESNLLVIREFSTKRVTFDVPDDEHLAIFKTIDESHARALPWPIIYGHRSQGIHYNR